jgi:hypothetical protein
VEPSTVEFHGVALGESKTLHFRILNRGATGIFFFRELSLIFRLRNFV